MYGYCHDGCGQGTKKATKTNRTLRQIEGEPFQYVRGHNPSPRIAKNRVSNLYAFLHRKYGTWDAVSSATGIPIGTIYNHLSDSRRQGISEANARKLVNVVMLYKDRERPWG